MGPDLLTGRSLPSSLLLELGLGPQRVSDLDLYSFSGFGPSEDRMKPSFFGLSSDLSASSFGSMHLLVTLGMLGEGSLLCSSDFWVWLGPWETLLFRAS